MSKKSLLYIIIIVCVLTSGFFLASNYRSSIEMKNRGENIVPSVNDNKDIITNDFDVQFSHSMGDGCPEDYQVWNEEHTEFTCRCDSGIEFNGICYDSQQEYCQAQGNTWYNDQCLNQQQYCEAQGKVWNNDQCITQQEYCQAQGNTWYNNQCMNQQEYCEAQGNTWYNNQCMNQQQYCEAQGNTWYNNQCMNQQQYCEAQGKVWNNNQCITQQAYCESQGKVWNNNQCITQQAYCESQDKYWTSDGRCINKTTDEYCLATGQGDKYVSGQGCMTSTTDAYCKAVNGPNFVYVQSRNSCMDSTTDAYCSATGQGDKYVPGNGCMTSTTDAYCIVTRGTHYSGGSCRSNADECVALELKGAEYKGSPDEKYNPTKCDSVADKCYRDGKVLYGGKCITYQQKCEEISKGTWKNGTCVTNNNGGNGVSGKTSNKDNKKEDNPKTDDVIGTDASLSDIVLSSGRLMFDFGTSDYRVEVSSNVESITIEPITTDPDATFVVNGDTKLKSGDNVFTIVVTAEDGKTTRTYNLTIVRTDRILSSNSKASLISIANHEINFDKDQTEYEVNLTKDEEELDIKVTAEDNLSITEVLGNEGLENGDIVTVKVTAEDGSYTVYAIKVNKEVPFNIKDYIPYIIAGVAGLLLIVIGVAILKGRKSNDDEDDLDEDNGKDKMKDDKKDDFKMKDNDEDNDDFKMKSKDSK